MALIGKIREKSGFAVSLIAFGLLIFIVGGDMLSTNSFLLGRNQETVGKIAGVEINLREYNAKVEEYKTNFALNNKKNPNDQELNSIKEQAWNDLIFQYSYKKVCEKAGIIVSDEELTDLVQGTNIHPSIIQAFTNPQTNEFDKNSLIGYLQNFSKLQPEQQYMWLAFERQLGPERLRNKFESLLKASVYVTKEEAKRDYIAQNTKLNGKCLFIPYNTIADSTIQFTERELENFLNQNKEKYRSEEYVALEYVAFPIKASKEDSTRHFEELKNIAKQFQESKDDTIFVNSNSDAEENSILANLGNLPQALKDNVKNFEIGQVYGPFLEGASYKLFKVAEERKDTVFSIRASHILFKTNSSSDADKQEALKNCREVLNRIKKGESFEKLASEFGTDGTSSRGGDLGWFTEGQMVKKFNDACFNRGTVGLLPEPVETEFGYHIIKITEPKTNKKLAVFSIERQITPSETTRDLAYNEASLFHSKATGKDGFEEAIKTSSNGTLSKLRSDYITKTSIYLNNLTGISEVIRWSFKDAKLDEVSPIFNPEDHYIVCKLVKKREKGTGKLEDYRTEILNKVRNEKKATVIAEKLKGLLSKPFDEISTAYGDGVQLADANNAVPTYNSLCNFGFDAYAAGRSFGVQKGKRSGIIKGENGVGIIEVTDISKVEEIADYTGVKKVSESSAKNSISYSLNELFKDKANILDNRFLF
ncbi:MAG: SurA N-terminal domain-containing protein [Cytophagales bacterium]